MNKFPSEQLEEFQQAFALFDRDGDGLIGIDDFGKIVRTLGFCPSDQDIATLVTSMQEQHPDKQMTMISFTDFLTVLSQQIMKEEDLITAEGNNDNSNNTTTKMNQDGIFLLPDSDALERQVLEAFAVFDKHHTGKIETVELRRLVTTLGNRLSSQEADEMMLEADPSHCGLVDYHDFVKTLFAK